MVVGLVICDASIRRCLRAPVQLPGTQGDDVLTNVDAARDAQDIVTKISAIVYGLQKRPD